MCRREEHVPFMNAASITRAWKTAANAAKRPVKSGWKRGIPNFLTKSSMKMSDRGCRRCGKERREKTKNGTDRRTLHDREAFFYYRNICLIIFINGCFNLCNHLFLKSPDLPFCITFLPIFNEPGIPPIRMTFNPLLQVLSEKCVYPRVHWGYYSKIMIIIRGISVWNDTGDYGLCYTELWYNER